MGRILIGICVVGVAAWFLLATRLDHETELRSMRDRPVLAEPDDAGRNVIGESAPSAAPVRTESVRSPQPSRERRVVAREPLARGECELAIGESFRFGADYAVRGSAAEHDIYCQDIRHGASLACPHGALEVLAPLTVVGVPSEPAVAWSLVHDAPAQLPKRDLWLAETSTPQRVGIGFVRARDGQTYKLYLSQLRGDPDALARRVRIRYEAVESKTDGGEMHLPRVEGQVAVEMTTRRDIRLAAEIGQRVPGGEHYASGLLGEYAVMRGLLPEQSVSKECHIVLDQLTNETVILEARGALWVPGRVPSDARLELDRSGGAIGVAGDVDGALRLGGYGHLHVGGSVRGVLELESYGSVVVLGDVIGTLMMRSYVDVYVRGRVYGTIDVKGSCWSTLYLQSFVSRAELEAMPGDFHAITLHLAASDLAVGTHEDVGTWRKVLVGDPVWGRLGR